MDITTKSKYQLNIKENKKNSYIVNNIIFVQSNPRKIFRNIIKYYKFSNLYFFAN